MKQVVILISGRGSNLEALIEARAAGQLPVRIAAVISNRPDASGLATAVAAGIQTQVINHKSYAGRAEFDAALAEAIDAYAPDLVVLAGFMRILTDDFVRHYSGRMLNIHPSLLPAFPGLDTHKKVLAEGVRIHGCTVHFVTPTLDHGPIVIQAAVPVLASDDEVALAERVLREEHRIYPLAVRWFAEGRLRLVGKRVLVEADTGLPGSLVSPLVR